MLARLTAGTVSVALLLAFVLLALVDLIALQPAGSYHSLL